MTDQDTKARELKCTTGYETHHYCPDEQCEYHKDLISKSKPKFSVEQLLQAEREKTALQSQIIEDLMGALDELKVYLGDLTVTSDPYAPTIVECFIEKPLDAAQAKLKLIRGTR